MITKNTLIAALAVIASLGTIHMLTSQAAPFEIKLGCDNEEEATDPYCPAATTRPSTCNVNDRFVEKVENLTKLKDLVDQGEYAGSLQVKVPSSAEFVDCELRAFECTSKNTWTSVPLTEAEEDANGTPTGAISQTESCTPKKKPEEQPKQ